MRSRLCYLGLAVLLGALVLAGCGVNPDAQTGGSAPNTAPAPQAEPAASTPIILPSPPPMPTSRPRPPTPTAPPAPANPAPAGASTLASADFSGGDLSAWTVIDATDPVDGPAVWGIQDNRLQQVSAFEGDIQQYPTALVTGDTTWQNYSVSAAAYDIANDEFGVVARAGSDGYYVFKMRGTGETPSLSLERYDATQVSFTTLASSDSGGFENRKWYNLRLQVQGDHLTAFVDGRPVLEATDATLKQGRAGVSGYAMGNLEFDNFTVQALAANGQ